jgi:hypothetical protein
MCKQPNRYYIEILPPIMINFFFPSRLDFRAFYNCHPPLSTAKTRALNAPAFPLQRPQTPLERFIPNPKLRFMERSHPIGSTLPKFHERCFFQLCQLLLHYCPPVFTQPRDLLENMALIILVPTLSRMPKPSAGYDGRLPPKRLYAG